MNLRRCIHPLRLCYTAILLTIFTGNHAIATIPATLVHMPAQTYTHAGQMPLSAAEQNWLNKNKTLRAGIVPNDLPPFDLVDLDNNYEGISAEYLDLIAHTLGQTPEVRAYPSHQIALQALLAGDVDILMTAFDKKHLTELAFSSAYYANRTVEVTSHGRQLDRTNSITLALVTSQLSTQDIVTYYPQARVIEYPTIYQALDAVANQHADAFIGNAAGAAYFIERYHFNSLGISNFAEFAQEDFHIATRGDDSPRLALINRALTSLSAQVQNNITKRWVSIYGKFDMIDRINLTEAESQWVTSHPVVTYSAPVDHMPFVFVDRANKPSGLSVQILDIISKRTGIHFTPIWSHNAESQKNAILKQQVALIPVVVRDNEYLSYDGKIDVTLPYATAQWVIVGRKSDPSIRHLNDLTNKRIAASPPNPLVDRVIRQVPGTSLITTDSYIDAYQLVANGHADITIANVSTANYIIQQHFASKLHVLGPMAEAPIEIAFGISRDYPELLTIMNKALESIAPDEIRTLNMRWAQVNHPDTGWRRFRPWFLWGGITVAISTTIFFIWILILFRQVRARSRAESALSNQLDFQKALLNGIPHPIYVRDSNTLLIACNTAYENAVGMSRDILIGKSASDIITRIRPADGRETGDVMYRKLLDTGTPISQDRTMYLQDKIVNIYNWAVRLQTENGNVVGLVGGWFDITERIHLLAELKTARTKAENANRAKSTFLATISHEIRTPMNALIGMLELLSIGQQTAQQKQLYLDTARSSAISLLALIDDILDLSKIEAGKLTFHPQPASLRQLINEVISIFLPVAQQKSMRLNATIESSVAAAHLVDPLRFKQILSNLVGNALKFTESGTVEIRLTCYNVIHHEEELLLTVTDTGIGIAAADLPKLFEPFSQADSTINHVTGGTGLGLSICQRLAHEMKGKVTLHSELGVGTRAEVKLVLERSNLPSATPSLVSNWQHNNFTNCLILIIDDHPANRLTLREQLQQLGCSVHEAENGQQGLTKCNIQHFDLIFCDCSMPVMDGYAFTHTLRTCNHAPLNQYTPVLGYTANAQQEDHQRAIDVGMTDCLLKPIGIDILSKTLLHYLGNKVVPQSSPPISLPTNPDDITLYNPSKIDAITLGDLATERRLLESLLNTNQIDLDALTNAIKKQEWSEVSTLTHRIKGAAGLISATLLVQTCIELEESCRGAVVETITPIFEQLQTQIQDLHTQLEARPSLSMIKDESHLRQH